MFLHLIVRLSRREQQSESLWLTSAAATINLREVLKRFAQVHFAQVTGVLLPSFEQRSTCCEVRVSYPTGSKRFTSCGICVPQFHFQFRVSLKQLTPTVLLDALQRFESSVFGSPRRNRERTGQGDIPAGTTFFDPIVNLHDVGNVIQVERAYSHPPVEQRQFANCLSNGLVQPYRSHVGAVNLKETKASELPDLACKTKLLVQLTDKTFQLQMREKSPSSKHLHENKYLFVGEA